MTKLLNFFFSLSTTSLNSNLGLLALRVLFGVSIFINHGLPTFNSLLEGETGFPDPIGIGTFPSKVLMTFAEFVCSAMVAMGLLTRLATVPLVIGFMVAFFIHHVADPFAHKELAYLYGSACIVILLLGPGHFSIDKMFLKTLPSKYAG